MSVPFPVAWEVGKGKYIWAQQEGLAGGIWGTVWLQPGLTCMHLTADTVLSLSEMFYFYQYKSETGPGVAVLWQLWPGDIYKWITKTLTKHSHSSNGLVLLLGLGR